LEIPDLDKSVEAELRASVAEDTDSIADNQVDHSRTAASHTAEDKDTEDTAVVGIA
jgi:hypothetical protein